MSRVCACPKREPMDGMPSSVKYRFGDRCRKRAYRAKVAVEAAKAGVVVSPSLHAIEEASAGGSGGRDGHAERPGNKVRRRRVELRVSYRKVVGEVERFLESVALGGYAWEDHHLCAELVVQNALSDKQREHLERDAA